MLKSNKFIPIANFVYKRTHAFLVAVGNGRTRCKALVRSTPTPTPTATPGGGSNSSAIPDIGANSNLNGFLPFPSDNAWNTPVDTAPLEPNPPVYLYSTSPLHPDFGGGPDNTGNFSIYGIPFNVVGDDSCPKVSVSFQVAGESDPGPYPICDSMAVENGWTTGDGNDHHLLVYDRDNHELYEIYQIQKNSNGTYSGYAGATWNTTSDAERPLYWTSSDAAGLEIFPALLKYDEVASGVVNHALRFTLQHSYNGFIEPARHAAGYSDTGLAPMGMRVRLKASVDISHLGPQAQVIATAMKKYGMILADNGSDWFFQGTNDPRWNDDDLNTLKTLQGSDFEVIKMGPITPMD